ncbi:hypothetical protein KAR91_40265 [Candidatus Pacearchaeota archaeon]|nr:hypothetical protein [Candidatus Pacearchaeota archaeon]
MTGEWNTEGRAQVILDTLFHTDNPLPVDVQDGIVISGLAVDIELGAVEIKDAATDNRATVTAGGDLQVTLDSEVVDISGSTVDTGATIHAAIADATNPSGAVETKTYLMGYEPITDDWWRLMAVDIGASGGSIADGVTGDYALLSYSLLAAQDGTGWRGLKIEQTNVDAVAATGWKLQSGSHLYGYNGTTWDRLRSAIATGLEVDTELPAAAALSDGMANPTAPAVGSFGMGWSLTLGQWVRLYVLDPGVSSWSPASDEGYLATIAAAAGWAGNILQGVEARQGNADGLGTTQYGYQTAAFGYGYNGVTWDRLKVDASGNLMTTVSGIVASLDTEFGDAFTLVDGIANPTTAPVGSFNYGWSPSAGAWQRIHTLDPSTGNWFPASDDGHVATIATAAAFDSPGGTINAIMGSQPSADGVGTTLYGLHENAFGYGFNGTTWDRLRSSISGGLEVDIKNAEIVVSGLANINVQGNDSDAVAELADNVLDTNSYLMAYNGTTWDRLRSAIATGLEVDVVAFPAAAGLEDFHSNPTTVDIGAMLSAYDEGNNEWNRMRSSALPVGDALVAADLSPALAVGALLGGFNGTTWDRLRSSISNGLEVDVVGSPEVTVSGLLNVNVQGNDGDAVGEQADNVLVTNAYLMGHNGSTWDRVVTEGNDRENVSPTSGGLLQTTAYTMVLHEENGDWDRLNAVTHNENDNGDNGFAIFGSDGSNWKKLLVDATGSLQVDADTELPAAVALANGMSNPTVPQVGAHLMGYDVENGNWSRLSVARDGDVYNLGFGVTVLGDDGSNHRAIQTDSTGRQVLGTGQTILRAPIAVSGQGNNELVALVGGEQIKVLSLMLSAAGAVDVRLESGGGADLTGDVTLAAAGDHFELSPPANVDMHHFETVAGEALDIDLSAAVYVGGYLTYYTE